MRRASTLVRVLLAIGVKGFIALLAVSVPSASAIRIVTWHFRSFNFAKQRRGTLRFFSGHESSRVRKRGTRARDESETELLGCSPSREHRFPDANVPGWHFSHQTRQRNNNAEKRCRLQSPASPSSTLVSCVAGCSTLGIHDVAVAHRSFARNAFHLSLSLVQTRPQTPSTQQQRPTDHGGTINQSLLFSALDLVDQQTFWLLGRLSVMTLPHAHFENSDLIWFDFVAPNQANERTNERTQ